MSWKKRARRGRRLLIASVGVASASFVGIGCGGTSVANLMAPPSCDVAPSNPYCRVTDAGQDVGRDAGPDAGPDVAVEAASEVGADAPAEVAPDAAKEAAGEAGASDAADGPAQGQ